MDAGTHRHERMRQLVHQNGAEEEQRRDQSGEPIVERVLIGKLLRKVASR